MLRERIITLSSRLLLAVAFLSPVASVQAKQPSVRFDNASAIACRVVTPPTPAGLSSGAKLIEARFRVSILLTDGRQEDVEDVMVLISSPRRRLRVADFSPKTEMANSIAGEVETVRTTEKTATAGAQIGGGTFPPPFALASASLGGTHHHVVAQTVKELPTKCVVLASGTMHGEHGVFFKVKGAPQVPLEGAKEFVCVFEVPKDWKGDWCLLSCQARGINQRYMSKKMEPCGQAETFVGLYLAGDEAGQEIARRLDHLQLPQAACDADRLALGLPLQGDQPTAEASHHRSFEFPATLSTWSKRPGLFEHHADNDATGENQTCVALRLTLDELGGMAGR
jgi:hypothetical protein